MSEQPVDAAAQISAAVAAQNNTAAPPATDQVTTSAPSPTADASTQSVHPAYQQILDKIPEMYRAQVIPTLKEWDAGVERKLGEVHSKYEPFKKYAGRNSDDIETGLQLVQALNTDARAFYNNMASTYGFEQGQTSEGQNEVDLSDYEQDPAIAKLIQDQENLRNQITQQSQQQAQREAEAELGSLIKSTENFFKEKGLDLDNDGKEAIIVRAQGLMERNGYEMSKAIETSRDWYHKIVGSRVATTSPVASQANTNAPPVMPVNGSVPANPVQAHQLSDTDRRRLGADALRRAFNP